MLHEEATSTASEGNNLTRNIMIILQEFIMVAWHRLRAVQFPFGQFYNEAYTHSTWILTYRCLGKSL